MQNQVPTPQQIIAFQEQLAEMRRQWCLMCRAFVRQFPDDGEDIHLVEGETLIHIHREFITERADEQGPSLEDYGRSVSLHPLHRLSGAA